VSEGGPEPRRRRWNEIKVSVFTVGVTIMILAAAAFVVLNFIAS
jgi:hypothetical protein